MKQILFFILLSFGLSAQEDMNRFYYFNDFIAHVNADVVGRDMFASNAGTNAGTTSGAPSSKRNVVGVAVSTTGTTSTGRALVISNSTIITFGGGPWVLQAGIDSIAPTSSAAQRYQLLYGFIDASTANQTDGAYFLYDEGGVSTESTATANWQCVTANNSSRTVTDSGIAVGTGSTKLRMEVNADGTEIVFYIDGVEAARHSADIPTTILTRVFGFGFMILKSIGATPATVSTDYFMVENRYNTTK